MEFMTTWAWGIFISAKLKCLILYVLASENTLELSDIDVFQTGVTVNAGACNKICVMKPWDGQQRLSL